MIEWLIDSPSPVRSGAGVVKKGSKMRSSTGAGMPTPVSATVTHTRVS